MKTVLNFGKVIALMYMVYVGYFLLFESTNTGFISKTVAQIGGLVIWLILGGGIIAKLTLYSKKHN